MPLALPGIREYEPMDRHCSWRAGGPARYYAEPTHPDQARALAAWCHAQDLPLVWLGRGTNTLVRSQGFLGLIAVYRAQAWQFEQRGSSTLLRIEAGATMAGMARRLAAMGLAGLAWAEGLPGTVGGAVIGNAGCYGGDMAGISEQVELLIDEEVQTWPVEQLGFGYRTSRLKQLLSQPEANTAAAIPPLVLAATLRLEQGDPVALAVRMATIAAERKGKTPAGSSCGSVFKNPPGTSAGHLIEQAGLKGRQVGAAQISPLHANYIINRGGADATDILALAELARDEVYRQTGIELEFEVRLI